MLLREVMGKGGYYDKNFNGRVVLRNSHMEPHCIKTIVSLK